MDLNICKALYDYSGDRAQGFATFNAGELLIILEKRESGWWTVECRGELGYAPSNYLAPITSDYQDDRLDSPVTQTQSNDGGNEAAVTEHTKSKLLDQNKQNAETQQVATSQQDENSAPSVVIASNTPIAVAPISPSAAPPDVAKATSNPKSPNAVPENQPAKEISIPPPIVVPQPTNTKNPAAFIPPPLTIQNPPKVIPPPIAPANPQRGPKVVKKPPPPPLARAPSNSLAGASSPCLLSLVAPKDNAVPAPKRAPSPNPTSKHSELHSSEPVTGNNRNKTGKVNNPPGPPKSISSSSSGQLHKNTETDRPASEKPKEKATSKSMSRLPRPQQKTVRKDVQSPPNDVEDVNMDEVNAMIVDDMLNLAPPPQYQPPVLEDPEKQQPSANVPIVLPPPPIAIITPMKSIAVPENLPPPPSPTAGPHHGHLPTTIAKAAPPPAAPPRTSLKSSNSAIPPPAGASVPKSVSAPNSASVNSTPPLKGIVPPPSAPAIEKPPPGPVGPAPASKSQSKLQSSTLNLPPPPPSMLNALGSSLHTSSAPVLSTTVAVPTSTAVPPQISPVQIFFNEEKEKEQEKENEKEENPTLSNPEDVILDSSRLPKVFVTFPISLQKRYIELLNKHASINSRVQKQNEKELADSDAELERQLNDWKKNEEKMVTAETTDRKNTLDQLSKKHAKDVKTLIKQHEVELKQLQSQNEERGKIKRKIHNEELKRISKEHTNALKAKKKSLTKEEYKLNEADIKFSQNIRDQYYNVEIAIDSLIQENEMVMRHAAAINSFHRAGDAELRTTVGELTDKTNTSELERLRSYICIREEWRKKHNSLSLDALKARHQVEEKQAQEILELENEILNKFIEDEKANNEREREKEKKKVSKALTTEMKTKIKENRSSTKDQLKMIEDEWNKRIDIKCKEIDTNYNNQFKKMVAELKNGLKVEQLADMQDQMERHKKELAAELETQKQNNAAMMEVHVNKRKAQEEAYWAIAQTEINLAKERIRDLITRLNEEESKLLESLNEKEKSYIDQLLSDLEKEVDNMRGKVSTNCESTLKGEIFVESEKRRNEFGNRVNIRKQAMAQRHQQAIEAEEGKLKSLEEDIKQK